jgi:hypothetical protein
MKKKSVKPVPPRKPDLAMLEMIKKTMPKGKKPMKQAGKTKKSMLPMLPAKKAAKTKKGMK